MFLMHMLEETGREGLILTERCAGDHNMGKGLSRTHHKQYRQASAHRNKMEIDTNPAVLRATTVWRQRSIRDLKSSEEVFWKTNWPAEVKRQIKLLHMLRLCLHTLVPDMLSE